MEEKAVHPEPVRVGVVGTGAFGRLHARTLANLAEAELVALVDRDSIALRSAAEEHPRVPTWTDLGQALSASRAEAWIVATTTESHTEVVATILSTGARVLVEKPLGRTRADAARLEALVLEDSSNLMVGHLMLFGSEFQGLEQEARSHGPIAYVQSVRHRPTALKARFPGENPLHLLMVHDLYMLQVLLEGAEPVRLSLTARRDRDGVTDLVQACLVWETGTVASLAASFLTPEGMPPDGFDRIEVFGEGWAARVRANPRPIEVWADRARWPQALEIHWHRGVPSGALAEELRCFCRVVRRQQPVPFGAGYRDALQVQRWLDKLADSLEPRAPMTPSPFSTSRKLPCSI